MLAAFGPRAVGFFDNVAASFSLNLDSALISRIMTLREKPAGG
jgi:hypothetical protein